MDDTAGQPLDPFEFHGHPVSSIAGLGGAGPLPDPTYAFHTPYVAVARGHAHFLIRFSNLRARRGSLLLRVHMLPDEPGAVASMVTSHRVQLNWLAHHGGETRLRFEAFRGARYALMGVTPDQLDASAEGLSITLDRPADVDDIAGNGEAAEARSTAYASDTVQTAPLPLLLSLEPPLFAQPVSQPCTAAQLREPAFRDRCKALGALTGDRIGQWQTAYAVQVLDRYGLLQAGARGLILGQADPLLERGIAAAGVMSHRVILGENGTDPSTPVMDPAALPGDLFAFDFLLSVRTTDLLGGDRQALDLIERSMECLRPGGLAVHVVGHHPHPTLSPAVAFDRNGLERVAVALISRGHQMARLKPPLVRHRLESSRDGVVPFGLVARRAALIR